jgi:uncharacterized membrane protein
MHIVDTTKFAIGAIFLVIGLVILARARGQRWSNQTKQAGALFLIGAAVFGAIGLGYIDLHGGILG